MRKSIRSKPQELLIALLKEARQKADLRQEDVARELGRPHQSFVAKYEAGQRRIDVVEFIELTKVLKTNPLSMLKKLIAVVDAEGPKKGTGPRRGRRRPPTR